MNKTPTTYQLLLPFKHEEIWKPVMGYEDRYEVSSLGNVASLNYNNTGQRKLLRPGNTGENRLYVHLWRNNQSKMKKVHRLVLEAFVGPCPKGMEGCHNDGNSMNNRLENLRWDTKRGNVSDTRMHGRMPRQKLSFSQVCEIKSLIKKQVYTPNEVAKVFGITKGHVYKILRGELWEMPPLPPPEPIDEPILTEDTEDEEEEEEETVLV